jgi:hypothetical protein
MINMPTPHVSHTNTDMSELRVCGDGSQGPTQAMTPLTVACMAAINSGDTQSCNQAGKPKADMGSVNTAPPLLRSAAAQSLTLTAKMAMPLHSKVKNTKEDQISNFMGWTFWKVMATFN